MQAGGGLGAASDVWRSRKKPPRGPAGRSLRARGEATEDMRARAAGGFFDVRIAKELRASRSRKELFACPGAPGKVWRRIL